MYKAKHLLFPLLWAVHIQDALIFHFLFKVHKYTKLCVAISELSQNTLIRTIAMSIKQHIQQQLVQPAFNERKSDKNSEVLLFYSGNTKIHHL